MFRTSLLLFLKCINMFLKMLSMHLDNRFSGCLLEECKQPKLSNFLLLWFFCLKLKSIPLSRPAASDPHIPNKANSHQTTTACLITNRLTTAVAQTETIIFSLSSPCVFISSLLVIFIQDECSFAYGTLNNAQNIVCATWPWATSY